MGEFRYVKAGDATLHPHRCAFWSIDGHDLIDLGVDVEVVDDPTMRRLYMSVPAARRAGELAGMVAPDPERDPDVLERRIRRLELENAELVKRVEAPTGFIEVKKHEQKVRGALRRYKTTVERANQDVDGFVPVDLPSKHQVDSDEELIG